MAAARALVLKLGAPSSSAIVNHHQWSQTCRALLHLPSPFPSLPHTNPPQSAAALSSSSSSSASLRLSSPYFRNPTSSSSFFQRLFYSSSSFSSSSSYISDSVFLENTDNAFSTSSASEIEHPWREWTEFLEFLKRKGYFEQDGVLQVEAEEIGSSNSSSVGGYRNTDLVGVKTACVEFARKRFDILRSLSKTDIKNIVEYGCPNLFRKAVNSAKRLRAFVKLDEGEVCSDCNLRGTCERAYSTVREEEGARTVDVVRLLLTYATDPTAFSATKSDDKVGLETSIRRLLSELIEVSNAQPEPSLPEPVVKPDAEFKLQKKLVLQNNIGMKKGDWVCTRCNFMNFARNVRCLECQEQGPETVGSGRNEMKEGDWNCPKCNFMNFQRNRTCLRCMVSRPKGYLKPGDWECPSCDYHNFNKNEACPKCNCKRPDSVETINLSFRPKQEALPGDWECPSCDFLNFRRNPRCKKCSCERPEDVQRELEAEKGHDVWRRPVSTTRMSSSYD